ncbi:unnamed protein product [Pseudo-nitzschia multistriata]|uniref:Uncharacterized protein n=1 Tax=Pseudo-nitzschia multistriata TaxID=183589 RepID=A0A448ZHK1_9STRA|nr:unnamed protein product [Pseudo-nitzschia multistriata]
MMMLTMTAPEAPTTTAIGDDTKPFPPASSLKDEETTSLRSNASSCTSLNSSCSHDTDTSCARALPPSLDPSTKKRKRVSFSLQQTAYFSPEQMLSKQERKSQCWYSEVELSLSREEARAAIAALHHQLQLDAAAAAAASAGTHGKRQPSPAQPTELSNEYGSWVLRCPHDETKIVCLRGIEKYADAAAKYAGQKRLVDSVLQQQSLNSEDIHVALVSRTLSQPFTEVARYYAVKSAEELDLCRKHEQEKERNQTEERKQQEEVATVLLLIMGQQENREGTLHEPPHHPPGTPSPSPSSSKLQEDSPIVTPRGSASGKRSSSFSNSPLCEQRNVKPCIRAVSDR